MTTITIKSIGVDDWSRGLYQDVNTHEKYVDVDGRLHTITEYGEPDCPLRDDVSWDLIKEGDAP